MLWRLRQDNNWAPQKYDFSIKKIILNFGKNWWCENQKIWVFHHKFEKKKCGPKLQRRNFFLKIWENVYSCPSSSCGSNHVNDILQKGLWAVETRFELKPRFFRSLWRITQWKISDSWFLFAKNFFFEYLRQHLLPHHNFSRTWLQYRWSLYSCIHMQLLLLSKQHSGKI